jgi:selenocysteine lyase/cysteine desulfurase
MLSLRESDTATTNTDRLAWVRSTELRRLEKQGVTYLDYAGAAPYPDSVLRQHVSLLRSRTLGNPHSTSPTAQAATSDVGTAKLDVLHYFDADPDEYDVCLAANCSAAIRLVAESFPWTAGSVCALTVDNHNSVNGMREFARARGARVHYSPLDVSMRMRRPELPSLDGARGLFAYPAQSNFSGVRHPLDFVSEAQRQGYAVLLDAAAYVPTSPLSLREVPADFVPVSFYKMFGYPTGIGALIARRQTMRLLRRPWFAGGTIDFVSIAHDAHRLKGDMEAFEDGTVNFLAASAVSLGIQFMKRTGPQRINAHVAALTDHLLTWLDALRDSDGRKLVRVYGPESTYERGGTVAFDVIDRSGSAACCDEIVRLAGADGISLRSGCFCNPGAAECALGADATLLRRGAVRASLGYGSSYSDIDRLGDFLKQIGDLQ